MTRSLRLLALPALALLATAGVSAAPPSDWQIGPFVEGRNRSPGMPDRMAEGREGPAFAFPTAGAGSVHYVTTPVRSLEGASTIRIRYRIDAAPGVRFVPVQNPDRSATMSLYFQRAGDRWTGRGRYAAYRWYSKDLTALPLSPGVHTLEMPLAGPEGWTPVMTRPGITGPEGFREAKRNAARVGFVFGSSGGLGHGVYATGPARFTLLDFAIR